MKPLEEDIRDLLAAGTPVALLSIVSNKGSTPRTAGTHMAVRPDGSGIGTIGGGRLEGEAMAQAATALPKGQGWLRRFELTGTDPEGMDMICGGVLDVLMEPLAPDAATIGLLDTFLSAWRAGKPGFWVVRLDNECADGVCRPCRALALRGRQGWELHGDCGLSGQELEPLLAPLAQERCPVVVNGAHGRLIVEPLPATSRVWLFGGGHVSLQVARIAAMMDFRVAVLDDREEFANDQRFPGADPIVVAQSFDRALFERLPINERSYLVILSRGHQYDLEILEQALRTPAKYIGMIGSRRKRDAVYNTLRQRGVSEAELAKVYSPIGVDIGAETPEEIGLCIVAELVSVRAGKKLKPL